MATGLHHTHLLSVVLFLLIYLIKTGLLLSNNKEGLAKFTKIFKVPEMIISVLFLVTGATMLYTLGGTTLLWIKIGMVFASIPLAIIGFKKENKVLAVVSLLLIIGAYGLAEVNKKRGVEKQEISAEVENTTSEDYSVEAHGKEVYVAYCQKCHGIDGVGGAMGLSLKITTLDYTQAVGRIITGEGSMPPFRDVLNEEEVKAVATYIQTLK